MPALRKFLFGGSEQRSLVLHSLSSLGDAFCLVRLSPYSRLKHRLDHPPPPKKTGRTVSAEEIVRVVSAIARRTPWNTCLMNAIAAQNMLAHYGHLSTLRIGVRMDEQGAFAAHAWLEKDGAVLIGGALSPATYQALEYDRPGHAASKEDQ